MAANKDISSYVLVLRDLGEEGGSGYALQLAPLQGRRARPTPPSPASGGPTSVAGTVGGVADGAHGDTGGVGVGGTRATPASLASNGPASVAVAGTAVGFAAGAQGDTGGGGGSGTRATRTSPAIGDPTSVAATVNGVAAGAHGDTGGGGGGTPNPSSPFSDGPASVVVTVGDVALAPGSQGGTGGGGGDGIEEAAAAAERNPGQIRTFLQNRCHIITQKEEVLIPIFYAPKKSKDDVWDRRQVKYVVALLGPLGFIFAATPYLPPFVLLVFAAAWGAGSVGFPMGLYGSRKHEQCFGRHMARLVLMSFSLLVLYMMYLSMIPVSTSVPSLPSPSSTDLAPSSPSGHQGPALFWIISYAVIGIAVMVGHIISWITGCHTGRDQDEDDSESTEKGLDTSALLQRFRDSL